MATTFTLLGTGTSQGVPVIGCDCKVCRSSDSRDTRLRASAVLQDRDATVLIDCGPDVRYQLLRAGVQRIDAVLITHDHNDHIIGLDDLRPFIFKQRKPIRIYAEPRVQASIRERFSYAFAKTPYPGAPRFKLVELVPEQIITIGSLPPITALRVFHGNLEILGFKIGAALAYLTDVKALPRATMEHLRGLDTIITSALHHHAHHSHMNLAEALELHAQLSPRLHYLIHMSHLIGLQAEVEAFLPEGVKLAYDTLQLPVEVAAKS